MEKSSAPVLSPALTGVFAGPIAGLKYQTPTLSGITTDDGEFQYREGEAITFLVGGVVLGAVEAAPRLNLRGHAEHRSRQEMHFVVDNQAPVTFVEDFEVRKLFLLIRTVRQDLVRRQSHRGNGF